MAADDATGSSVTLVAQWNEAASFTVSFDTGAGTPVGDKTNLTENSSNLLPLHDIAPVGFRLTGWTFKGMTVTQLTTYGELAQHMLLSRVPTENAPAPELSAYLWLVGTPQSSIILNP